MAIKVQEADFNTQDEIQSLLKRCKNPGALVTFTGLVRGHEDRGNLDALELEHYPGMTEKQLLAIEIEARERWKLQECLIIHRHGALKPKDQIVLVVCISEHRTDAFEAASFLMDWLKTNAPFWKKEVYADGTSWVEAKTSDQNKAKAWNK